ncbi:hypothetical protein GCM10028792_40250 [Salinisphaera aquimarina]
MNRVVTPIAIVAACVGLAACGQPDHPKHPPGHGARGVMVAPPQAPSIHFKVNDANGNTLDLQIECGVDTSLKDCAQVNQSIIDKVSKIRGDQQKQK